MKAFPVAAAAAGLALAGGAPALALSGQCFWDQLDPPTRGALLDGYQRLGPDVLDRVFISDRELRAIDTQCAAASVDGELKERLLAAVAFEHGSAVFLKGWLQWSDADLQAAWSRLRPEQTGLLRRQAQAVLSGAPPSNEDLSEAVEDFLGRDPGRLDPGLADQARGYLTSRAMREAIERRQS